MHIKFVQDIIDKLRGKELYKPKSEWLQVYFKAQQLLAQKNEIEDLFLGLSYGQYGINPEYLSNNSYNCCMPSMDLYTSYKIYSYYCDELAKLKNVYIAAAYYSPGFSLSKSSENFRLQSLEIFCGVKDPCNVINPIFKENFAGVFNSKIPCSYINGYEKGNLDFALPISLKERVAAHFRQYDKYGQIQLQWLYKLKKLSEINGHNLNIILFPFTKEYYDELSREYNVTIQEVNSPIKTFCKKNGINVLDFSCLNIDKKYFCDYDHMTEEGALLFSKKLNECIQKDSIK